MEKATSKFKSTFSNRVITPEQSKDTGMAMTLLSLIAGLYTENQWFFIASVALLVIDMIVPNIFRPIAIVWFGFSTLLGSVVSKFLLTLVFFLIITPMGRLKKIFGSESLQLGDWKRNASSAFFDRSQTYNATDLENPF